MDGIIMWSPGVTLEAIEKQVIQRAYQHFGGNKSATAQALGISVRTLESKFEKYYKEAQENLAAVEAERRRREVFLMRCRGITPPPEPEMPMPVASSTSQRPQIAAESKRR